jgi:hypothetical protein
MLYSVENPSFRNWNIIFKLQYVGKRTHLHVVNVQTCYMTDVLSETGTAFPSLAPGLTPGFFVGSEVLILLVFYVVLLCVFTFVLWSPYKNDIFTSNFVVGGFMSYLYYLCLFAFSSAQHILCFVFALIFVVLCTLCCQFLWIVHFWFVYLTFISYIEVW